MAGFGWATSAGCAPANAKMFSLEMSNVGFSHFIHGRPKSTAEVANGGGIALNDFDDGTDG